MIGTVLHLAARAADAAHGAAVIGGARLAFATWHARRHADRQLAAAWWVWLVMRPR